MAHQNSDIVISVMKSLHVDCGKHFFEIARGNEIETCPHCNETLVVGSVKIIETRGVDVVLDAKTGVIVSG